MEAAKESFAQRHSLFSFFTLHYSLAKRPAKRLHQISAALNLLQHSLGESA